MLECKTKRIWKVKIWMRDQAVSAHVMQSWVKRQKHIESSHFSPNTSRFCPICVWLFSVSVFALSLPRPPPSLGITCLKFVWSAFAFATLTWHLSLFVGQQDLYLVRIVGWKAPNTLYHSLEEKLTVPNTEEKYSFWSRTYVPGCLQARFWFLAGKWGSVNHREIVSNWLAKPLYENWTYTSSRGYCQIFLL